MIFKPRLEDVLLYLLKMTTYIFKLTYSFWSKKKVINLSIDISVFKNVYTDRPTPNFAPHNDTNLEKCPVDELVIITNKYNESGCII